MAISIDVYNGTLELNKLACISGGACTVDAIKKYTIDILNKLPNPRFLTVANYIYKYLNDNVSKKMDEKIFFTLLNGKAYEEDTKVFAKQFLKNPEQFLRKKPVGKNNLVDKWYRKVHN